MAEVDDVRGRDLDRLLTMVDAIVAIAITLLVLPLVELTADLGEEPVRRVLADHQGQLWSFLLSFAVIARLWWAQHEAVRGLVAMPPGFFGALMTWTVTIVFLPFPTALVAQSGDEALTKILYISTTAASMAVLVVIDLLVERHPRCRVPGVRVPRAGVTAVNVGLLVLALVISLALPVTSYLPLLLLAVDQPVARLLRLAPRR